MATQLEHWTHVGPIKTAAPPEEIERVELRAAASVGDPAPMGLLGYAVATFSVRRHSVCLDTSELISKTQFL